jgi:hypothetical protein
MIVEVIKKHYLENLDGYDSEKRFQKEEGTDAPLQFTYEYPSINHDLRRFS